MDDFMERAAEAALDILIVHVGENQCVHADGEKPRPTRQKDCKRCLSMAIKAYARNWGEWV